MLGLLLRGLFSSCRNQALLFATGHRLPVVMAPLAPSTGSRARGLQELRPVGSVAVGPGLQSTCSAAVVHTGLVAPRWVESPRLRDGTRISCSGGRILYHWAIRVAHQYNDPLHLLSLWVWKKNYRDTWPVSPMCVSLFWSQERLWQPFHSPRSIPSYSSWRSWNTRLVMSAVAQLCPTLCICRLFGIQVDTYKERREGKGRTEGEMAWTTLSSSCSKSRCEPTRRKSVRKNYLKESHSPLKGRDITQLKLYLLNTTLTLVKES